MLVHIWVEARCFEPYGGRLEWVVCVHEHTQSAGTCLLDEASSHEIGSVLVSDRPKVMYQLLVHIWVEARCLKRLTAGALKGESACLHAVSIGHITFLLCDNKGSGTIRLAQYVLADQSPVQQSVQGCKSVQPHLTVANLIPNFLLVQRCTL